MIRALYATGEYTQKKLAEMYGVRYTNIGNIIRGESWRHLL